jgi:ATP-dependent DNA helicase RecG
MVKLRVPQGRLLDEVVEVWLAGYNGYITSKLGLSPTEEQRQVLAYFYKSELLNRQRYFTILLNESNNHFHAIDALRNSGLLSEHVASTEEAPVFILDRILMRTEFHDELRELMGDLVFNSLDQAASHILNLLYQYTVFQRQRAQGIRIDPGDIPQGSWEAHQSQEIRVLGTSSEKALRTARRGRNPHARRPKGVFFEQGV